MIPPFRVYLFDLDGTLVDSAVDICGAIQGVPASTRRNDLPFDFLRGYIGRHLNDLFQEVLPEYSPEQMEELVVKYRKVYLEREHASTRCYPTVKEVLSRLPGKKSTATTKGTPTARAVLERFGLLPYFDHVQGTDGFPAKPEPDIIYKALEGLGEGTESCLFVGDSVADMEAAQRAGVKSCAVTYGYGRREDLERWRPDYWVDDLQGLIAE